MTPGKTLERGSLNEDDKAPPEGDLARQYRDLLLDAFFAVDADSRVVSVGGACELIFGYTPAEMVGKNMLDLVHPEDLERTLQSIERVMAGYQQRYFENRYVRKNGDVVFISWSAAWSEEHQVRVGVARDVTRRRTDAGPLVMRELLADPQPCWRLSASPRLLRAPDGVDVPLSTQDHAVLRELMNACGVVTRRTIIEALGGDYLTYDQRRLDTQMRRLRRKVQQASSHPLPISTLRAIGFQFCERALIES